MTELDIMKHAKSYLDSLSQGIDPISGQPVPNDSVLNNVRLEKCFRYVSGVLEQVIANGGKVVSGAPVPFYITPEELQCISPAQEPLRISQLAKLITDAVDDPQRIPLRATVMTDWLLEKGFIEKRERPDGKFQRLPTPTARHMRKTHISTLADLSVFQLVGRSPKPFESQVPCELRPLRALI